MKIEQVILHFVELPLKTPFETSFGVETVKSCWILELKSAGITGYAESVADVEPLYSEETHASVYYAWRNHILPRLMDYDLDGPESVRKILEPVRGNRMAKAAIEMAVWDWWAKSLNQTLSQLLGGDPGKTRIPVGVSIGIQPTDQVLVDVAQQYLAAGYQRLKVKIKPGREFEPLSLLRHAVGDDVRIMADANSAYRLTDIPILKKLDTLNLMMLEQPLAEDDYVDHAELAREVQTPICLDESIRSAEDARRAIALGSAEIINIKVGRVGGLAEAKRIHNVAMENQVPVWCGGMLEIGIGRAHNLHLTTLPNFVLPGDTSASDRYFHEDIIANPFVLNSDGTLTIPTGPGIGVFPDPDKLKRFGTYHEAWDIPKWHLRGGKPNAATLGF